MNSPTDYIEINPDLSPSLSIIWLHGLGADGNDFAPVAHELALHHGLPPIRFVLPHAPWRPVTINNGYVMRAWYDIISTEINHHADMEGIRKSCAHLHDLINAEKTRGIPANRIILAGFSQGAVIALATGLTYPEKLLGVLALSGYLPWTADHLKQMPAAHPALPILLGHGTEDNIVPISLGEKTRDALCAAGYHVNWHSYPMAHSVCAQEIKDIAAWIRTLN